MTTPAARPLVALGRQETTARFVALVRAFAPDFPGGLYAVPVLAVRAAFGAHAEAFRELAGNLPEFDWVVFLAAPAVEQLAEQVYTLGSTPRTFAADTRVACVGEATAERAERQGWRVDLVGTGTAAETLRALADRIDVAGARVLVPRSSRAPAADPALAPLCAVARVTVVVAYETVTIALAPSQWEPWAQADPVLCVLSGSAIAALIASLPDALCARLRRSRVAALGPRAARVIRGAGFTVSAVADPPRLQQLAELAVGLSVAPLS